MHTLAVDQAKHEFVAFLVDELGQPVHPRPKTFPQTLAGFRQLLRWLPDPRNTRVVFEATGVCSKRFVWALHDQVASLHEMNPRLLKRAALNMCQTKTDHADARAIAEAALRIRPRALDDSRLEFDETAENISVWLSEHDRLRRAAAALVTQIQDLQCNPAPAAKTVLARRRTELRRLRRQQAEAVKRIQQFFDEWKSEDVELVRSVKGIGLLTAAALVTRIRNISRFESADALKGYFGLYPARSQSGRTEGPSRMARHGSAIVRHMIWNAAKSAARYNPVCRDLYRRLLARGKPGPACIGAVARKLIQIVYGVLTNRKPFTIGPEYA